MSRIVLGLLIGVLAGAGLGYLTACAGGTCPLMCGWGRGGLSGGLAGLLIAALTTNAPKP